MYVNRPPGLLGAGILGSSCLNSEPRPKGNLWYGTVDGRNPAPGEYPISYRILDIPGGCLGFLPSTVIQVSVFIHNDLYLYLKSLKNLPRKKSNLLRCSLTIYIFSVNSIKQKTNTMVGTPGHQESS